MGRTRTGAATSFLHMLVRPQGAFRAMLADGRDGIAIAWMVVAGIVWVVAWAQLLHLGRYYETGRIFAAALVIGPVAGCAGMLLTALAGVWLGNLLDRNHGTRWQFHVEIPPFPLKNLVWKRLLGADGLRRMWSLPVLRQVLQGWSVLRAGWRYLQASATGGRTGYWMVLGMLNQSGRLFLPLGIVLWVAVNFLGADGFGKEGQATGWDWPLAGVNVLAMALHLWHWAAALRTAFALPAGRAWVAAVVSQVTGLGAVAGILVFSTGVNLT